MRKASHRALLFAALAAICALPARAAFTERAEFGTGATLGVAWGDPDRDGDADLAVAHFNAPNQLFTNNGDGTFTGAAQFGTGASFAVVWADKDNDGDLDIGVGRSNNQQNLLYINNGDGTFTQQNQFGTLRTTSLAWGDFDNDGDLDMAVGNGILGVAQQNALYVNNGDGTFTQRAEFGLGQTDSLVWGDFDDDGDLDLAVGNGGFGFDGQNYLYVNNGDGTFTERAEFGVRDTACMAWGDADNDGDLDMAVGNWDAGGCYLYVNNGNGTFTQQSRFGARDTNTLSWGDFDNDGDLDLAVGNGDFTSAEQNYLYVNDGTGTFTEQAEFGLGSTDSVVWADFDADGDLDLAAGNEHTPPQNYLYVNEGSSTAFLAIRLIGHFHDQGAGWSNRDGIGARVLVYEAGHLGDPAYLLGMREVEAHGGFSSQNPIDPHFGLAGVASVDVRIRWPGSAGRRILQDVTGIAAGQRIVVDEAGTPAGVPASATAGDRDALLVYPNPSPGRTTIAWRGDRTAMEAVTILDVAGREVWTSRGDAAGQTLVTWDGFSREGRRAPAGVYFVRGTTPRGSALAPLLLLP
jgi:hypothetical protein